MSLRRQEMAPTLMAKDYAPAQYAEPVALADGEEESLLGSMLIDAGVLQPSDVERIVSEQGRTGRRFGEVASDLGLIDPDELRQVLARQYEFPVPPKGDRTLSSRVVVAYQPTAPFAESMRALRTQLRQRWLDGRPGRRALTIAGVASSEGRSFIAANLAVSFAHAGLRTLLIDADMRRPMQHRLFRVHNKRGLSGILAGRGGSEQITRLPFLPELAILPAGPTPPNPQELLVGVRFSRMLARVAASFDVVLIDTPAASDSADALVTAQATRSALLVARRDLTPLAQLRDLEAGLRQTGVSVVGLMYNEH